MPLVNIDGIPTNCSYMCAQSNISVESFLSGYVLFAHHFLWDRIVNLYLGAQRFLLTDAEDYPWPHIVHLQFFP